MLPGLEAAELPADAIEVGRIADAWGIKGWFKVLPYSADPEALFSSKHSDTVVASAHEVDDRTAAEALRGARIFVARSSFPSAEKDEYYWVDLIGLDVVNREGLALGTVKELLSTGAQTVLVLEYSQDGKPQERMIPFVSVYIDEVDLPARRILVDWQADF
jgi:16S rRNA processing protein RimM